MADRSDPKKRFTNRVEHYLRNRPGYPRAILYFLHEKIGLEPGWVVADIGSGTGFLTELFLEHGNRVHAVEPNSAMRHAAEERLAHQPAFSSVNGSAEATTLPAASVDLVTAGQAFHWFEPRLARAEFQRILRPPGWTMLVWNERLRGGSAFMQGYEDLLVEHIRDYPRVGHQAAGGDPLEAFFAPGGYLEGRYENHQTLDWEGFRGRLLSSSYAPLPGQPGYEPLMAGLRQLFAAHQKEGMVYFEYLTTIYLGYLTS